MADSKTIIDDACTTTTGAETPAPDTTTAAAETPKRLQVESASMTSQRRPKLKGVAPASSHIISTVTQGELAVDVFLVPKDANTRRDVHFTHIARFRPSKKKPRTNAWLGEITREYLPEAPWVMFLVLFTTHDDSHITSDRQHYPSSADSFATTACLLIETLYNGANDWKTLLTEGCRKLEVSAQEEESSNAGVPNAGTPAEGAGEGTDTESCEWNDCASCNCRRLLIANSPVDKFVGFVDPKTITDLPDSAKPSARTLQRLCHRRLYAPIAMMLLEDHQAARFDISRRVWQVRKSEDAQEWIDCPVSELRKDFATSDFPLCGEWVLAKRPVVKPVDAFEQRMDDLRRRAVVCFDELKKRTAIEGKYIADEHDDEDDADVRQQRLAMTSNRAQTREMLRILFRDVMQYGGRNIIDKTGWSQPYLRNVLRLMAQRPKPAAAVPDMSTLLAAEIHKLEVAAMVHAAPNHGAMPATQTTPRAALLSASAPPVAASAKVRRPRRSRAGTAAVSPPSLSVSAPLTAPVVVVDVEPQAPMAIAATPVRRCAREGCASRVIKVVDEGKCVELQCSAGCRLVLHSSCERIVRRRAVVEHSSLAGTACITDGCQGRIVDAMARVHSAPARPSYGRMDPGDAKSATPDTSTAARSVPAQSATTSANTSNVSTAVPAAAVAASAGAASSAPTLIEADMTSEMVALPSSKVKPSATRAAPQRPAGGRGQKHALSLDEFHWHVDVAIASVAPLSVWSAPRAESSNIAPNTATVAAAPPRPARSRLNALAPAFVPPVGL